MLALSALPYLSAVFDAWAGTMLLFTLLFALTVCLSCRAFQASA